MKFAICNELFESCPLQEVCLKVCALGYEGIEIAPFTLGTDPGALADGEVTSLRGCIADSGLQCVGLHWLLAGTGGLHLTTGDRAVRLRTAEHLARLAGLCRELGGRVMVLGSPKHRSLLPNVTAPAAFAHLREVIERLVPALEANDVTLAIEPLGPEETDVVNTAGEAAALVDSFQSPHVRLQLDVKAMATESMPIPDIIRGHRERLVHFHANDPNRLGPGMGDVDFVPILAALNSIRYDGWISVEAFDFRPGADRIASESIANLRRASAG
jgi:sugar phosphate isomerase/epimerase